MIPIQKPIFIFLFSLCCFSQVKSQNSITLSGFVSDKETGEYYGNVKITIVPEGLSTYTNTYGFYSITLKNLKDSTGKTVYYQLPGFETGVLSWTGFNDTTVHFKILSKVDAERLDAVEIRSKKNTIADKVDMSRIDVPINQIKEIPALLGEKDVLKVIQLLPGVQTGGEGQSGLYVRGGGPDQNLLLLDEAIVYNASHLFGFFSVFNGDALKSVELVKGGFPARYGGRLSSVIDLSMKEGNNKRYTGEVGVGILSSRFTFEGPIQEGKSSFMISGRRTYIDLLIQPIVYASTGNNAGYYFYDFNAKANFTLSDKDRLFLSGYFGKDNFYSIVRERKARLETDFGWGNRTLTARWNHVFSPKLFSNASIIYSHYNLNIGLESYDGLRDTFQLKYQSVINDIGLKYDFDWRPHPNHQIRYGFQTTQHQFQPAALVLKAGGFGDLQNRIKTIYSYESGVYIEDIWKWNKFQFNPGFRLSHYYVDKANFVNPEPRFSTSYNIKPDLAVKASFARMFQYIHLLSNSGISLPTDLWIPATAGLLPMRSEQTAVGVAKDFDNGFSLSWEAYYKDMKNVAQYREGASFLLQDDIFSLNGAGARNWEQQITRGTAWSYGTEWFLQKKTGDFTGWIGYTLSWTQMKFEELNFGRPFWARYDRRHDISVVGSYKITKNVNFAFTWVYGTGNAITLPQGYVPGNNHQMSAYPILWNPQIQSYNNFIDFGNRNDFRMEAYHRLDLGLQFHKEKTHGTETWEISIYNAYNQANPFFYYGTTDYDKNGDISTVLKKVNLFPVLPSISWSFKFK
jgi:hypothetical protein